MLPSGWVFIIMCIVLRLIEGVGSALFMTGALAIVPQLYPDSVGRVTVSNNLLLCNQLFLCTKSIDLIAHHYII